MTVGIFMLYFNKTQLNEAYIASVSFANVSVAQSFIFTLKISSDAAFLISRRTISHIFGESPLQIEPFLKLYGFCTKRKIFFTISGHKSFLNL